MPGLCAAVSSAKPKRGAAGKTDVFSAEEILRHFSEQQVNEIVSATPMTAQILNQVEGTWLSAALAGRAQRAGDRRADSADYDATLEDWKQWRLWQREIAGRNLGVQDTGFVLGIRLDHSDESGDGSWRLNFFAASSEDPSLRIDLEQWWTMSEAKRSQWLKRFGDQFERHLLVSLGHAARVCPLLWQGMETEHPSGVDVDLEIAYAFLRDDSLVLESAGFRILLPSWWMPQGRRRARIKVMASGRPQSSQSGQSLGMLNLPSLVDYSYELSVGGEPVSEQEWQELIHAKLPLVRFRGEWMEIDRTQMQEMLEMLRRQDVAVDGHAFGEMLGRMAEADENVVEYAFDEVLHSTLQALQQQAGIKELQDPAGLNGGLRQYQRRGLSWLATQEALGLNPCLADDMGLGKTIQVIALLLYEKEKILSETGGEEKGFMSTLLIAPTSVLSNWRKEVEKFAPQLKCLIHHGSGRTRDASELKESIDGIDIMITSFTIASRDRALLKQFK